jgi:hypothetical protein
MHVGHLDCTYKWCGDTEHVRMVPCTKTLVCIASVDKCNLLSTKLIEETCEKYAPLSVLIQS